MGHETTCGGAVRGLARGRGDRDDSMREHFRQCQSQRCQGRCKHARVQRCARRSRARPISTSWRPSCWRCRAISKRRISPISRCSSSATWPSLSGLEAALGGAEATDAALPEAWAPIIEQARAIGATPLSLGFRRAHTSGSPNIGEGLFGGLMLVILGSRRDRVGNERRQAWGEAGRIARRTATSVWRAP